MKILHVINSLQFGGAEKLLVDELPIMARQEHIELLVLNGKNSPFMEKIKKQGILIHEINTWGGIYNPVNIFYLRKYIKQFDIIHVHLFPSQYWVSIAKFLFGGRAQIVTTEHSTSNKRFNHRWTMMIDRCIYKQYQYIFCISEGVRRAMEAHLNGKQNKALAVVPNGIDTKRFVSAEPISRKELNLTDKDVFILQVARFGEQKDQDCLIRALTYLPDNYVAVFAGDGDRLKVCQQLASQLNVINRCRFLSNRTDIPNLWSSADIGVMSSHWEGFGLSAVECMASGKPILVSDVDGLREVVSNDELCFPVGDAKLLAKKIQQLIENPDKYKYLAEHCYQQAQKFDISMTVNHYLSYYYLLMKQ
jgi:glycosyltransferase involved in cell wall biosynthesis